MQRIIISILIIVLGLALMALSGCESRTDDSPGPIQYDNAHEETTASEGMQYPNEHIQYSNEHVEVHSTLPKTGGIKVW